MSTVELRFTALPEHVRTARLIAAAVARRSEIDEAVVDEIKLAVGEACSRAVQMHRDHGRTDDVVVQLTEDHDGFAIRVCDRGPVDDGGAAAGQDSVVEAFSQLAAGAGDSGDPADLTGPALPGGFGLALIAGLVDDLDVESGPDGTVVRMRWPGVGHGAPTP